MLAIILAFISILSGTIMVFGTHKKWRALVNPEKDSANVFEFSNYVSKKIMGDQASITGNYLGGAIAIIFGLVILLIEFVF